MPIMRLTSYTDYTLRTLIYLGMNRDRLVTIQDIADNHLISKNHLMKVVQDLRTAGYLDAVRERTGGVRLAKPPSEINVGEVVRHTEGGFELVDCSSCLISPACGLTGALHEALAAFMAVLDGYTLADLIQGRSQALQSLFESMASQEGKVVAI